MEKSKWIKENTFNIITLSAVLIIFVVFIYRGCNKPIEVEAIQAIQSKIDTLYNKSQEKKEKLIDTLIIEKTNEKETIKRLQDINNYYQSRDTYIDTIPIVISTVRSPFAAEKLKEWELRNDTGYYDIPK